MVVLGGPTGEAYSPVRQGSAGSGRLDWETWREPVLFCNERNGNSYLARHGFAGQLVAK